MTTLGVTSPFYGGGQVSNPANVIILKGASTPSTNSKSNLGTLAVNNASALMYGLVSKSGGVATWAVLGGSTGAVATINSLAPVGGNIIIAGTSNQVSIANAGHTVTLSLPSAITTPG